MSLFGSKKQDDPEREPLLPQHNGHVQNGGTGTAHSEAAPPILTDHQKYVDKRLHTYLIVRALARGYLPSTDQLIAMLRKLLASDFLRRDNPHLTTDGKKLVNLMRTFVSQLIELLNTKNGRDELQEILSTMRRARVHVDLEGLGNAVTNVKVSNAHAAYNSLSTIGSLLMQNSDFNKLFNDATTVVRQVLGASASTAAEFADKAANQIEPSDSALDAVGSPPAEGSAAEVRQQVKKDNQDLLGQLGDTAVEAAKKTKDEAAEAFDEAMTPERKRALKTRVRDMIQNLRRNTDYQTSVSTVSILLKQYLLTYSTAIQDAADEITDDVRPNRSLNKAGALLWSFITTFGESVEWERLKEKVDNLMKHKERDPDFEKIVSQLVDSLYNLFTNPNYLFTDDEGDESQESFYVLKEKFREIDGPEGVKDDLDDVVRQMGRTWRSVWNDKQVAELGSTSRSMISLMFRSSDGAAFNRALLSDVFHIMLPLALEFIQFIPIPRITLTSPDLDLLLEPLILEPGRTVNHSSFLPYNFGIVTTNEFNLFKGRNRMTTNMSSTARVKIQGITVKAEGVGYVMRFHKNFLFRFTDSGIASFKLDEKGVDINLDLEFTRSLADHMVFLKGVHVKLHKLDFTLKRSKFSFLAWIMRPFVRPLLRKLLQKGIRDGIETALRTANKELVYTRERLRATKIAQPSDLTTFLRAVLSRWRYPYADDEEVDFNVGWRARDKAGRQEGPFDGVYAPGSLVGLFETEGLDAGERVEENELGGWRNESFTV